MSLRANALSEGIRDVAVPSGGTAAGDQAARDALGREVLQALREIDRAAEATPSDAGALCGTVRGATASQLAMSLASQSPVVRGAVAGATSLIGASGTVHVAGRLRRQA